MSTKPGVTIAPFASMTRRDRTGESSLDGGDQTRVDRDVGFVGGTAGAVDDPAVLDQQIVHCLSPQTDCQR